MIDNEILSRVAKKLLKMTLERPYLRMRPLKLSLIKLLLKIGHPHIGQMILLLEI